MRFTEFCKYKNFIFKGKTLTELAEKSNICFKIFKDKSYNIEKKKSVSYKENKEKSSLGIMYLLPKRLFDVRGRLMISNCDIPPKMVSE